MVLFRIHSLFTPSLLISLFHSFTSLQLNGSWAYPLHRKQ